MRSILVLVERHDPWSPISWCQSKRGVETHDFGYEIQIQRGNGWISISHYNDMASEFEADDYEKLHRVVSDPVGYYIEWGGSDGVTLVEEMLQSAPQSTHAAVDNDNGVLVSIHLVAGKSFDAFYLADDWP